MKIHLIAVGKNMPSWVEAGYAEYAKRLPADYAMILHEIQPKKRGKGSDLTKIMLDEGEAILERIPPHGHVVALDRQGQSWSTLDLAKHLHQWHDNSIDLSLLVGGPEGLSPACLARANAKWSLSQLTLPHAMVRVIVAEQFYRAWSVITQRNYHR